MKKIVCPFLLMIIITIHCSSRRPVIEMGGYTFEYEGRTYRIESMTPNFLVGYNLLILEKEGQLILKAMDKEQNGVIDEVVIGDITRREADKIYHEGIEEGRRLGYIKTRIVAREYRTSDRRYTYVLVTYLLAVGDIYNEFSVYERHFIQKNATSVDLEANGILDQSKKGEKPLGFYQKLYREILDKGVREGRIKKKDGYYIVVL